MGLNSKRIRAEQMHILGPQGVRVRRGTLGTIDELGEATHQFRPAIHEGHQSQDRFGIINNRIDLFGEASFGFGPDPKFRLNRADGLDKVFLDCKMAF